MFHFTSTILQISSYSLVYELYPNLDITADDNTFPESCYDPMLGGVSLDIFTTPIYCILVRYFDVYKSLWEMNNDALKMSFVRSFYENLGDLAQMIKHCRDMQNDSKRTRLGLTPFVVYNQDQYSSMFHDYNLADSSHKFSCINKFAQFETNELTNLHESKNLSAETFIASNIGPVRNQLAVPDAYFELDQPTFCPNSPAYAVTGQLESQLMRCASEKSSSSSVLLNDRALVACVTPLCPDPQVPKLYWEHAFKRGVTRMKKLPTASELSTNETVCNHEIAVAFSDFTDFYCEQYDPTDEELKDYLTKYGPLLVYISGDESI